VQRGGDLGTFHGKTDKCAVIFNVFGSRDRRQDHTMQRFGALELEFHRTLNVIARLADPLALWLCHWNFVAL